MGKALEQTRNYALVRSANSINMSNACGINMCMAFSVKDDADRDISSSRDSPQHPAEEASESAHCVHWSPARAARAQLRASEDLSVQDRMELAASPSTSPTHRSRPGTRTAGEYKQRILLHTVKDATDSQLLRGSNHFKWVLHLQFFFIEKSP